MTAPTARVLVLAGPSGSGKSRLARRLQAEHGWPVVELDDFYREAGDPALPMSPLGLPDWDDVGSWDQEAALAAVRALCREGEVEVPVYDISASARVGSRRVRVGSAPVVVAEGIFAAHIVAPLVEQDLLAGAWCISGRPWVTFGRRFVRDVSERRKSLSTLWRRGHHLRRSEEGIVRAQQALGALPMTSTVAEARARDLLEDPAP
jgi:uridine kinase